MATTKLNAMKSASRAVNYTERHAIEKNDSNCNMDYTKSSSKASRELYGKTDDNQGYVIIQLFRPDEVTPEQCSQLGLELAEKLAPNHQIAVYAHNDTDHVHSHIVINSIDLKTDKKFNNDKQTLRSVRNLDDEICRGHGLSVPEHDTAELRYAQAEKALIEKDRYSWKNGLREKIESAGDHTNDFKGFSEHLKKSGIESKVRGKNISYKPENVNKWVHDKTLGEDYDEGALEYEFERQEGEEGKESERDAVAAYTDQSEINWDTVGHNTEQLRKTKIRRAEKAKQAYRQASSGDTKEPEYTRERTKTTHIGSDRGDEGFSR